MLFDIQYSLGKELVWVLDSRKLFNKHEPGQKIVAWTRLS